MTISNVQIFANGSSYGAYNQKLTQETRQKLEMYGITFNNNITEAQGKKLLAAYEAQNSQNSQNQNSNFQGKNKEDKAFEQLKNLAQKIGITVKEGENFQTLVKEVENELKTKIQASADNMDELRQLRNYSQELADIQTYSNNQNGASMGYNSTNQALMLTLEMMSQYNKNLLLN